MLHVVLSTIRISGRVRKGSVPLALYWDTVEPYHYVRLTPDERDPQNYEMLISGGEDHLVAHANDYEERFVRLERWTRYVMFCNFLFHFFQSRMVVI